MAYLDRLRERPFEAGATTDLKVSLDVGTVPTPAGSAQADPVDGRPIARTSRDCKGYELMLQGLCRLKELAAIVAEKSLHSIRPDPASAAPFDLHYGDSLPGAQDRIPARRQRAGAGGGGAGRHFRAPCRLGRSRRRLVAGNGRPGLGRRHPTVSRPGYRLSRRPRRQLDAERRRPFPAHQFLRSGQGIEPGRAASWVSNPCTPSSAPRTAAWWRCVSRSAIRSSSSTSWC